MLTVNESIFNRYLNLFKTEMGLNSSFSIFQYSNKFQNFLNENSDDLSNIREISISKLLEQDLFQKTQEKEDETDSKTSAEENLNFFKDFLLKLFNDKTFVKSVNKNQNKKIDQEELEGFLNAIDEDKNSKLTFDELFNGLESLKDGTLENIFANNEPEQPEEPTNPFSNDLTEPTESAGNAANGAAGTPSGGTKSTQQNERIKPEEPTVSDKDSNTNEKSLNNMSIEELEQERTSRNEELSSAQNALNDVFNGNNENIKAAQNDVDSKKEAYETALQNDEKVSQELKDKQTKYNNEISQKENNISELKININNKNSEIYSTQSLINQTTQNINNLEAAISALSDNVNTEDSEAEQENSVTNQKAKLTEQLNEEKKKQKEYKQQLVILQQELNGFNKQLETENGNLEALKDSLGEIETEIAQNCGEETKTALEEYNTAKNNLNSVKNTEETNAQQKIKNVQNSITEVENALNTKKSEQKSKPQTENVNLKAEYLTEEKTKKSYLMIGPENPDPNTEYPVMVFIPGEAQHGAGEQGLYADTTPAGVMKNWNLENFNGYIIIPSQPANMKNWYNDTATNTVKNILDDLNSKQKTGKTVIVGASSGAPGAGYMASKLGNNYFDEVVCIAGYPYGNTKINMPISYYFGSEDERTNNIKTHVNKSNLKGDMIEIEGANHNDIVKVLLTANSNNDNKSDFLQKLFGIV